MGTLSYGTKVRIIDRSNYYYGKIGYINDDNSFDMWLAEQEPRGIVPEYMYNVDVPTPDNQDIEHTSVKPIRVIRSRKK